jgi:hypothetical protein
MTHFSYLSKTSEIFLFEKFDKKMTITQKFSKFKLFPIFLVLPQTRPQTKTLVWWTFFLISQRCPSYCCLNKDVLKISKSSFTLLRLVLRQPFAPNFETSIWLRKKQPGWKKKTLKKKDVIKKKTLFSNTDFLIPSLSRL